MKSILAILLFTIGGGCTQDKVLQENVQLYYQKINEAESYIVCENYKKALTLYEQAFQYKTYPFAIDLYNQMYCASFAGNEDVMYESARKLVTNKGLSLATIEKHYSILRNNEKKWEIFKNWYPEGHQVFLELSNAEARALFNKIADDDQKFRVYEDRYTTYKEANETVDSINFNLIKSFIDKNGYPTQEMIGMKEISYKPGFIEYLYIPLRHYYHHLFSGFIKTDITDALVEEVKKGNLEPDYMEEFIHAGNPAAMKISHSRALNNAILSVINDNLYISPIDSLYLSRIDSMRSELYLEDTKSLYAKSIFSLDRSKPFSLKHTTFIATYNLTNPEEEAMTVQIFQLVPLTKKDEYFNCQ